MFWSPASKHQKNPPVRKGGHIIPGGSKEKESFLGDKKVVVKGASKKRDRKRGGDLRGGNLERSFMCV